MEQDDDLSPFATMQTVTKPSSPSPSLSSSPSSSSSLVTTIAIAAAASASASMEHKDALSPVAMTQPKQAQVNSNPSVDMTMDDDNDDDDNGVVDSADSERLEQARLHEKYMNQDLPRIQKRLQNLFVQRQEYSKLLPQEQIMIDAKEVIIIQQLRIGTLEVLGEYVSIKEAAIAIRARQRLIRNCLAGKANRGAGCLWRYVVADQPEQLDIIRTYREKQRVCSRYNPIEKLCKTTGKVLARYDSIRVASEANNIRASSIYGGLQIKNATVKGFRWRYVNESTGQEVDSQSSSLTPPRNNDDNDNHNKKRPAPSSPSTTNNNDDSNNNNNEGLLSALQNVISVISSEQGEAANNTNAVAIAQLITQLLLLLFQQGGQQQQQQQQAIIPLLSQVAALSQQNNNNNNPYLLLPQHQAQQNFMFQSATASSIPPVVAPTQAPMLATAAPTADSNNNDNNNSAPLQPKSESSPSPWTDKVRDLQERIRALDKIIKEFSDNIDDDVKAKFETKRRKLMLDLVDLI